MFSILTRSSQWSSLRKQHLILQSNCQACGSKKNLEVHHIIPVAVDPSRELDRTNLITLCKSCHFVFGHFMDWHSWNSDIVADSLVYYNKILNKPYKIRGQRYDKNFASLFYDFVCEYLFFWYYRP